MKIGTPKDIFVVLKYLARIALLYILSIGLTYLATYILNLLTCCDGWFDAYRVLGLFILSFVFSLFFIFTLLGGKYKYFWLSGTTLFIVAVFRFYDSPSFLLYMVVAPGIIGWGLGALILKFLKSRQSKA